MRHNRQTGRSENTFQRRPAIHQHISRRTAHKQFDARNTVLVELVEQCHIIIRSPKEETVVHMTLLSSQSELLLKRLQRRRLRNGIRHIEIGGHTASGRSPALTLDVSLLRQTRLTEMHMIVDDTWEYKTSRSIYDRVSRYFGIDVSCNNLLYLLIFDDDRTIESFSFVDNGSALNDGPHFCGRLVRGTCSESAESSGRAGVTAAGCAGWTLVSSTSPFSRA